MLEWVTDREVFLGCMSVGGQSAIKDSCWFVWMVYGPRGPLGVNTVGPRAEEMLQMVSVPTRNFVMIFR